MSEEFLKKAKDIEEMFKDEERDLRVRIINDKIKILKDELRKVGEHRKIYQFMRIPPLKEFQVEAVNAFMSKKDSQGRIKGTMLMPTGTGKTIVAMELMKMLCPDNGRAIVLVPTEALLGQWRRNLTKSGLSVGTFYGKGYDILNKDVVVGIYNSTAAHLWIFKEFDFIVADEVHHIGSPQFQKILGEVWKKKYAVGLTSVITRLDGMQSYILSFLPIFYELTLRKAIERGWVSELKIHPKERYQCVDETEYDMEKRLVIDLTPAEWVEYREYKDIIDRFYIFFPYENVYEVDHPLAYAARKAIAKRKVLLANAVNKRAVVHNLLREFKNERILIFNTSIESIEMIRSIVNEDKELQERVVMYHSKMDRREKEKQLELFRIGTKNIMFSVKALEEGLDVPEASIGVIVASDKTKRSFIQKMGRIMRPTQKKWKDIYVIYARGTVEEKIKERMEWLLLR